MNERVNRLLHASPAISNDPKMIAAAGAEKAIVEHVDPLEQARIAGFVVVMAYTDGSVSAISAHLSKGDADRALANALFASGATKIGNRKELD